MADAREKPLFEARYEMTSLLTQEAASLLTPTGTTNPAYILVYACLGALLIYALVGELADLELNVPIMLILAFAIAGLLYVAQHWQDRMRRRLADEGLDAAFIGEGDRNFEIDVFEDRVVERSHRGERTYPLSTLRTARVGELLVVLQFADGTVIVPKKSLSASRFNQLKDFVRAAAGTKPRRKRVARA